jgi:hypothetical protein
MEVMGGRVWPCDCGGDCCGGCCNGEEDGCVPPGEEFMMGKPERIEGEETKLGIENEV